MVPEIWSATDRIFCHCGPFLCPFTPLTTPKIKIFKKWIKTHGDITILHICIINDNHMMSGFWDVEYHGQNVLLFWIVFCYFTHLTTQKIQILKKKEKKSTTDRTKKWHIEVGGPPKETLKWSWGTTSRFLRRKERSKSCWVCECFLKTSKV